MDIHLVGYLCHMLCAIHARFIFQLHVVCHTSDHTQLSFLMCIDFVHYFLAEKEIMLCVLLSYLLFFQFGQSVPHLVLTHA